MPSARLSIEQTCGVWSAEIEVGGTMARTRTLRADDFDAMLAAIGTAYRELTGAAAAAPARDEGAVPRPVRSPKRARR